METATIEREPLESAEVAPATFETRSLENPNLPVSPAILDSLIGYGPTRSGVQINEHTATTMTAVLTATRILAESIGQMPLVVYQGDEDDNWRVRAKDHPAYDLLRRSPNSEMTSVVWKETAQGHAVLWGNSYSRIIFDNAGRPKELWPLRPDQTHPERVGGRLKYVSGRDRFDPEEILHVPSIGFNGIQGYSPIALAREAIALGKAAEIFGATFFGNGAQLSGVIEYPGKLKPEARKNLLESWKAQHSGVGNSHKTALFEEGMKYTPIGIPPADAQFVEVRKFQIAEVARIFRIPLHMMGDLERATNANIETQSLEFLKYTLAPWMAKWEAEINKKLLGPGYFCRFDVREFLRTDLQSRQVYNQAAINTGWKSPNEVRADEGDPAGGPELDVYRFPVNMVDAKNAAALKVQNPALSAKDPPADPKAGARSRMVKTLALPILEAALGRMLRKEGNALSRVASKPDDERRAWAEKFYPEHCQHVDAELLPATILIGGLLGLDERKAIELTSEVRAEFATMRNSSLPDDVNPVASDLAKRYAIKACSAMTRKPNKRAAAKANK